MKSNIVCPSEMSRARRSEDNVGHGGKQRIRRTRRRRWNRLHLFPVRDVTFGQMEKGDRADNTAEDGRRTLEPTLDGRPPLTYVREGGEG